MALVAFDVVNGEPDRSSGLPVLETLARGDLKDVREFHDALARIRPRLDQSGSFSAANVASRLEGLTKAYGAGISVGQATRDAVQGIVFRELDRVQAEGKDAPVAIFEPIATARAVPEERLEELKLWGQALKLSRAQHWDQAELILFNLQSLYPGAPLYSLYAHGVARYRRESPGPGWEGVTAFETKSRDGRCEWEYRCRRQRYS